MTDLARTYTAIEPASGAVFVKVPLLPSAKGVASDGPGAAAGAWSLGRLARFAYRHPLVVAISLVYLYILPLARRDFLRREVSYSLIAPVSCSMIITLHGIQTGTFGFPQPLRGVVLSLCCLRHPAVCGTAGGACQNGPGAT